MQKNLTWLVKKKHVLENLLYKQFRCEFCLKWDPCTTNNACKLVNQIQKLVDLFAMLKLINIIEIGENLTSPFYNIY